MQISEQLRKRSQMEIGIMSTLFLAFLALLYTLIPDNTKPLETNFCPLVAELTPQTEFLGSSMFYSDEYSNKSLKYLQGAVRIPTVAYDDMGKDVRAEPRFDIFRKFHKYMKETFPLAAKYFETVNEYGILYTVPGKNSALKPIVLMAHQDVVPVDQSSLHEWKYPPFDAHFDGEFLYGRGSSDTKNSLIAIVEAVESLLQQKWVPERTVIMSFGFDEEISGARGAHNLAQTLLERYGEDGIEVIIDEGAGLMELAGGRVLAITVGEKGYVDIDVSLKMKGGHSSLPPDHTSIGIISELVTMLESNPFPPMLSDANPVLPFFQCVAEHGPKMNEQLRRTILDIESPAHRSDFLKFVSSVDAIKYLVRTSQAADVMIGGTKVNALPESAEIKVNHRINVGSSSADIIERFEMFTTELAQKYDLGIISSNETLIEPTKNGFFDIKASRVLEVAPVSPFTGEVWEKVAGTGISVFKHCPYLANDTVVYAAPALFPANTDTKHYWLLSRSIYRFNPVFGEDMINYHTVSERLRWRSHLTSVAWFYEFILNTSL